MLIKTYKELRALPTFEERLDYCKTFSKIGEFTFSSHRYLNQRFYTSELWKWIRREVILRDSGCDLGVTDGWHEIIGPITIHHLNPIAPQDIIYQSDILVDPNFMICVSSQTHKLIHYNADQKTEKLNGERSPNDMCPWR